MAELNLRIEAQDAFSAVLGAFATQLAATANSAAAVSAALSGTGASAGATERAITEVNGAISQTAASATEASTAAASVSNALSGAGAAAGSAARAIGETTAATSSNAAASTEAAAVSAKVARALSEEGAAATNARVSMTDFNRAISNTGSAGTEAASGAEKVAAAAGRLQVAATQAAKPLHDMGSAISETARSAGESTSSFGKLIDQLGRIGLASQGFQALKQSALQLGETLGINLNNEYEQTLVKMKSFAGSQEAAVEILKQVREEADKTPFSFRELANSAAALLPVSKSSGVALMDLTRQAEVLAALNPAQGLTGAAFALREAMGGDFMSVIERFDLPRDKINKLKAEGVPALEVLQKTLAEMGVDQSLVANMAESMTGRWSTFMDLLDGFKKLMGEPIFEQLKLGLMAVSNLIEDNADTFRGWAVVVGESIAAPMEEMNTFLTTTRNIARDHGLNVFEAALVALELRVGEVFGGEAQGYVHDFFGGVKNAFGAGEATILNFITVVKQLMTGDLVGALDTAAVSIVDGIDTLLAEIGTWATAFTQWVVDAIPVLQEYLLNYSSQLMQWILDNGVKVGSKMQEWRMALFSWAINLVDRVLPLLLEFGTGILGWIRDWAPELLSSFLNEWLPAMIGWAAEATAVVVPALARWAAQIVDWLLGTALPMVAGTLVSLAMVLGAWVVDGLPPLLANLGTMGLAILAWIADAGTQILARLLSDWIPAFVGWAIETGVRVIPALIAWVTDIYPRVYPALLQWIRDMSAWLAGPGWEMVKAAALRMAGAIWDGLKEGLAKIAGSWNRAMADTAQTGIDGFAAQAEISSPSAVMQALGINLVEGAIAGVEQSTEAFRAAMTGLAEEGAAAFSSAAQITSSASEQVGGLAEAIGGVAAPEKSSLVEQAAAKHQQTMLKTQQDLNAALDAEDKRYQRQLEEDQIKFDRKMQDLTAAAGQGTAKERQSAQEKIAKAQQDHAAQLEDYERAHQQKMGDIVEKGQEKLASAYERGVQDIEAAQQKQAEARYAAAERLQIGLQTLEVETQGALTAIGERTGQRINDAIQEAAQAIQDVSQRAAQQIADAQANLDMSRALRERRQQFGAGQTAEADARKAARDEADYKKRQADDWAAYQRKQDEDASSIATRRQREVEEKAWQEANTKRKADETLKKELDAAARAGNDKDRKDAEQKAREKYQSAVDGIKDEHREWEITRKHRIDLEDRDRKEAAEKQALALKERQQRDDEARAEKAKRDAEDRAFREKQQAESQAFSDLLEDEALARQITRIQTETQNRIESINAALLDKQTKIAEDARLEVEKVTESARLKTEALKKEFFDKVGPLEDDARAKILGYIDGVTARINQLRTDALAAAAAVAAAANTGNADTLAAMASTAASTATAASAVATVAQSVVDTSEITSTVGLPRSLGGGRGGYARGGMTAGGWTLVGEEGPELVRLPGGSTVYPAGTTSGMMQAVGGGNGDDQRPVILMLDGAAIAKSTWGQLKRLGLRGTNLGLN